ncbi:37S ribosomal protein S10 [Penicillium citrinum]|uniref:Small ribosomal subunit protein uS10m n=2 Tax=Penicillium TaxID=5073 RepID=A0A9W9TM31_PENCI|nr:37S ribosomal protein S10 [Penicillium citrinum]KAJ5231322.1 37S ribosomal protein S10 [Penicillium citrinum]KAJ5578856.1 37S ribosomal protein S10 [Penicillium hetheringtonii]
MFSNPTRSLIGATKRLRVPLSARWQSTPSTPNATSPETKTASPVESVPVPDKQETPTPNPEQPAEQRVKEWSERLGALGDNARLPRSVQAVYMRPLRRKAEYGLPVCDLQLRSYSVENVEFFADFAIRAAYYLNLPVSGPVPLPRITERWTVPRSNFVHKKSQENFERITLRRLIQIKDGNPQAVQAWLAFLRKHAFYGVGMKANIWEHESLDVSKTMDQSASEVQKTLEPHLSQFGQRHDNSSGNNIFDTLDSDRFAERKTARA